MSDLPAGASGSSSENRELSRAVRFVVAAIVLALSYPNIHVALGIHHFQQIFADMLGGKTLPTTTQFVLKFHLLFATLSLLWPLVAVVAIFAGGVTRSLYLSGFVLICAFIQFYFLLETLLAPMSLIIKGMAG